MSQTTQSPVRRFLRNNNVIFILLLVIVVAVLVASPKFTKPTNIFNLLQSIGTYGILAIGLTFIFIVGGIDLSIGYQVAFCGTIFAILVPMCGVFLAALAVFLIGCAIGYINGTIVTRLRIPALIGTLAVMTVLHGLVLMMNGDRGSKTVSSTEFFGMTLPEFYNIKILGFISPSLILLALLAVGFGIFLRWTRTGTSMYVTGGNREAGALSGINNNRIIRLSYTIGGFCAALCSVLCVFRNNASTYNMGDGLDITAICAVVIGGIKMNGGKGNMAMCVMGVAVLQIINNVMIKLGLHSSMQALITGIVVVLVLIADKLTGTKTVAA